jgi:hypothetical protein
VCLFSILFNQADCTGLNCSRFLRASILYGGGGGDGVGGGGGLKFLKRARRFIVLSSPQFP